MILLSSCSDSREDKLFKLITNNGNIIENNSLKIYDCENYTNYKKLINDGLQELSFNSKDDKKIETFLKNKLLIIENFNCNECFKEIEESKESKVIKILNKYKTREERIYLMIKICELDSISSLFKEDLKLTEEILNIEFVKKRAKKSLKEMEKKEYFSNLENSIIKVFNEKYLSNEK